MNYFDIIISIPLIWGAYKGFKKGFVIEVASLVALVLGIWGGIKFSSISAKYLSEALDISEKIMPLISFIITFILIVIIVFSLGKVLEKIIKMVALGMLNKLAGALFGVLKFVLILSVGLFIINKVDARFNLIKEETKKTSLLYEPISKINAILLPEIESLSIDNIIEEE